MMKQYSLIFYKELWDYIEILKMTNSEATTHGICLSESIVRKNWSLSNKIVVAMDFYIFVKQFTPNEPFISAIETYLRSIIAILTTEKQKSIYKELFTMTENYAKNRNPYLEKPDELKEKIIEFKIYLGEN